MEKHATEMFREVLRDMRRHGFTQLRPTAHGMLYGFKDFRITVPTHVPDYTAGFRAERLKNDWDVVRGRVLAEYPGLKLKLATRAAHGDRPEDVALLAPIENPEDLLREDEAEAAAIAAEALDAGMAPPAIAPGGETYTDPLPTESTTITEEVAMPTKVKRSKPIFRTCPVPGCTERSTGKHNEMHRRRGEWKKEYDQPSRKGKVIAPKAADNGAANPIDVKGGRRPEPTTADGAAIDAALAPLRKLLGDLQYQADYYKLQLKEREEAMDKLRQVFSVALPPKRRA